LVIYAIYTRFTLGLPTHKYKSHKDLKNITYTCGDIDTYKSVGHANGRQVEKCIGKFGRKSRCPVNGNRFRSSLFPFLFPFLFLFRCASLPLPVLALF